MMITNNELEAAVFAWSYLWCKWFHKKHHSWHGDYYCVCLKCCGEYFWPAKFHMNMTARNAAMLKTLNSTMAGFKKPMASFPPSLLLFPETPLTITLGLSPSHEDFPEDSPILEERNDGS